MNTQDLVRAIASGNTRDSQTVFSELMQSRIDAKTDDLRLSIASNMFVNEESIDELSKSSLGSYIKKANDQKTEPSVSDRKYKTLGTGIEKAAKRLDPAGTAGLSDKAMDSRMSADKGEYTANVGKKIFHKAVDKLTK